MNHTSVVLRKILILSFVAIIIFRYASPVYAESNKLKSDSTQNLSSGYEQFSARTKELVAREFVKNTAEFRANQVVLQQGRTFVAIKNELENARNFLRQGYSYLEIKDEIDQLTGWKNLAGEGVITDKDKFQTVRNLTTTSILLKELLNRTNDRLKLITSYHKILGQFQYRIDSLMMDSVLYIVPADSVSLVRYFQRLVLLNKDIKPVNIPLKTALDSIEKLEIKVSMIKFSLESDIAETESQRKVLYEKIGIIEKGSFGRLVNHDETFEQVVAFSLNKAKLVLWFYMLNHLSTLIMMFLFIIGIAYYLRILSRKHKDEKANEKNKEKQQVILHPIASATLIVLTGFQFFLPLPPFALTGLLWLISGIALSMILWKSIAPVWYKAWLVFFGLFLVGFLGNLLLWQSAFERWTMLVFILSALAAGIWFLFRLFKHEVKEKPIMLLIGLMIVIEILALINYLAGGYNQSKTFMASGVFTVILAYFLYWSARLGNNVVQLSFHFFKGSEYDYHGGSRQKPSKNASSTFFYILFFTGWFILISRNFYFYQTMF